MDFEISAIPTGMMQGWRTFVNGEERKVAKIEIVSKFGKLSYGLRPEGYDGWAFREMGGGGAVTMPYTLIATPYPAPYPELLVALVREKRPNMGEIAVWCAIGGFIEPGESHKDAQVRETAVEAGLDGMKAQELPGLPANCNRAFFVADAFGGEGIHVFGLKIPSDQIEKDGETWKLKDTALLAGFKKADDVRFFHWRDAVRNSPDAIARAAIAQLLTVIYS